MKNNTKSYQRAKALRELLADKKLHSGKELYKLLGHRFSATKGNVMHGEDGEAPWEIETVSHKSTSDGNKFIKAYRWTGRENTKPPIAYEYTRPWLGWSTDYPDEGSVAVNALNEEALRLVSEIFCANEVPEGEDPMEVTVRPVTAEDVARLQEAVES